MISIPISWAVAVTAPNQTEKVVEQFAAHSIQHFFPRIKKTAHRCGRRIERYLPLLFNYIPFILTPGWPAVYKMRGVVNVIGPVIEGEMDRLKEMCPHGIFIPAKRVRFMQGQTVSPLTGPLQGKIGTYKECLESNTEIAFFNMLGSLTPIEFKTGELVGV